MQASSFSRFAVVSGILAGVCGLLYSVAFVLLRNGLLSALFLMLGGLFSLVLLVALFERLSAVDARYAILGLILGSVAALGSAIHGAYDLANVLHPPAENLPALANLPNPMDPRGFLTFCVAGLAVLIAANLIGHDRSLPSYLKPLSYVLGVLLIIVYLGRLIVLDASSLLILLPAALTGFIVNPLWYILLGQSLGRVPGRRPTVVDSQD